MQHGDTELIGSAGRKPSSDPRTVRTGRVAQRGSMLKGTVSEKYAFNLALFHLSTHNPPPLEYHSYPGGETPWANVHPLHPPPATMIHQQQSFLLALLKYPEYGQCVRYFRWTLMFASNIKGEGGPLPAKEILQYSEIETWDAFKGMVNIQKLDFVSLHANCTPYLLECPSSLFSSALLSVCSANSHIDLLRRSFILLMLRE